MGKVSGGVHLGLSPRHPPGDPRGGDHRGPGGDGGAPLPGRGAPHRHPGQAPPSPPSPWGSPSRERPLVPGPRGDPPRHRRQRLAGRRGERGPDRGPWPGGAWAGRGVGYPLLALAVFGLFGAMFLRLTGKHLRRIRGYGASRQPLWRFFDRKGYGIMAAMMGGGLGLRYAGLVPEPFVAVFYTGLGCALALAGVCFLGGLFPGEESKRISRKGRRNTEHLPAPAGFAQARRGRGGAFSGHGKGGREALPLAHHGGVGIHAGDGGVILLLGEETVGQVGLLVFHEFLPGRRGVPRGGGPGRGQPSGGEGISALGGITARRRPPGRPPG